jgi:hypothetical protein
MASSASATQPVLLLYRQLLRAAKIYPSKNRNRIVSDIKSGFRSNMHITDAKKIGEELSEARQGLKIMSGINSMVTGRAKDWSVTVGAE